MVNVDGSNVVNSVVPSSAGNCVFKDDFVVVTSFSLMENIVVSVNIVSFDTGISLIEIGPDVTFVSIVVNC